MKIVRGYRKLALLCCIGFTCSLAVWWQSPWTTTHLYERLTLLGDVETQQSLPSGDEIGVWKPWRGRPSVPKVVKPELSVGVSGSMEPQERLGLERPAPPWVTGLLNSASNASVPQDAPSWPKDLKEYIKGMLKWDRPNWQGHWPPFADYVDKEYDPNRWERFALDYRTYNATLDQLNASITSNPVPYRPFPSYNSKEWNRKWKGEYVACHGPRGLPLNISTDDEVRVYQGVPAGFPQPFVGGYGIIGLDDDVCFDRYSRYGAYGFGDDEVLGDAQRRKTLQWERVRWGELQDDCLRRNEKRYLPEARTSGVKKLSTMLPNTDPDLVSSISMPSSIDKDKTKYTSEDSNENGNNITKENKYQRRTAVLIRAWTGYTYEANDLIAIRSLISELSLHSGAEYTVYLYVHVKDGNLPIFENATLYDEILRDNVPEELRDIAILWSEFVFPTWYPKIGDWQVYWMQFMCLQQFSLNFPGFDYVWNWESDARYLGHHYHLFEQVAKFADMQPRKLLWERNKRYYLPSVHGSYQSFVQSTHEDVLNASAHFLIPEPVWGPRPYIHATPPQTPLGPTPPHSFDADEFTWGVNEPADFITLLPMWDPRNTSWSYKDKIWNYIPGVRPIFTREDPTADSFTHPGFEHLDRRVFINTVVRFSKRMLHAMHTENLAGRSMQAEMWPSTVALQHGLKAVYAPHPIFSDREWPAPYASAIFDTSSTVDSVTGGAEESVQGAWTEQADSPYNHDRESNFGGWSWYFSSRFPRNLYRRWLGWEVVMQEWGMEERVVEDEGRMCLPGMLLHPVKKMGKGRVKL